jgi:hypothetical protein
MNVVIGLLVLLGLCLALAWAVISIVQNLTQRSVHDEPAFRDPGPIFHHGAEQQGSRSQFAWQSRLHSKAPD